MRCIARAVALAAAVIVAGCSLFRKSDVQVATITSIVAPDTVYVNSTFHATITACLGSNSGYVLDRFEVGSTDAQLSVQAWSRDTSSGRILDRTTVYSDLGVAPRPTEPGDFRLIAIQPDGRDTLKTITVLP
jgi:hypothetical protein